MSGDSKQTTAEQEAWERRVADVMALAVTLCHYHAPGCPFNSCCSGEPRCLAEAWAAPVKDQTCPSKPRPKTQNAAAKAPEEPEPSGGVQTRSE